MVVGSLTRRAFGFPANPVYSCSGPHGCAPLAQRIEHLTTDQKVGGSNPSWRANVKSRDIVHSMSRDFLCVGRLMCRVIVPYVGWQAVAAWQGKIPLSRNPRFSRKETPFSNRNSR